MKTFLLPDLAEGLNEAEINEWHVQIGDIIKVDQPLVSVETAKAVVEVPSPYHGKIVNLYAKKGEIVATGKPLVDFELMGEYTDTGTVVGTVEVSEQIIPSQHTNMTLNFAVEPKYKASPAVRALAKKLKVDLNKVVPTGKNQIIQAQDIENAAKITQIDFEPLKGPRRQMVLSMQKSHAEVVPVTVFDDADITVWGKKDYTTRLLLALCYACQYEPALNAWYDGNQVARRLFKDVNIGVAIDSEEGLFVPVMHRAHEKTGAQMRENLEEMKKKVQARTITLQEMTGATIMLSNFGKFAGRYANPIVVPPIVAILAVGQMRQEVKLTAVGIPEMRQLLPLSLTFDHRAVTGGEATRFLAHIISALQQV